MNGPAIFMRCHVCYKLTLVNAAMATPDFFGDSVIVSIPTSIVCSSCVRTERATNE